MIMSIPQKSHQSKEKKHVGDDTPKLNGKTQRSEECTYDDGGGVVVVVFDDVVVGIRVRRKRNARGGSRIGCK
jgi:hypothetical protein